MKTLLALNARGKACLLGEFSVFGFWPQIDVFMYA